MKTNDATYYIAKAKFDEHINGHELAETIGNRGFNLFDLKGLTVTAFQDGVYTLQNIEGTKFYTFTQTEGLKRKNI